MRHLASIQRIVDIQPIPDAQKIEKLTILGWSIVALKNQHKVGELVVFCEVDSILPFASWSEFLRNKNVYFGIAF